MKNVYKEKNLKKGRKGLFDTPLIVLLKILRKQF